MRKKPAAAESASDRTHPQPLPGNASAVAEARPSSKSDNPGNDAAVKRAAPDPASTTEDNPIRCPDTEPCSENPVAPKPSKKSKTTKTRKAKSKDVSSPEAGAGCGDVQPAGGTESIPLDRATTNSTVIDWANRLLEALMAKNSPQQTSVIRGQIEELRTATTAPANPASDPIEPTIVRDQATLRTLAKEVAAADEIIIDLETSGLDHREGEIVGLGMAFNEATYYIPVGHRFAEDNVLRPDQLPLANVLAALELQNKPLIAHNSKFEWKWLQQHGNIQCHFIWDTMLVARLLRSDLPADLEKLAVRELDVPEWGLSKNEMKSMQHQPISTVARYCAKDCWYTQLIYRRQQTCLN